jgi:Protein of unknown function (DUF3558)
VNRCLGPAVVLLAAGVGLLSGCSGGGGTGTVSSTLPSGSTASGSVVDDDVPKVQNPLPATVLEGSPCDSALTAAQLTEFIGATSAPESTDFETGPKCNWTNASHNGSAISVYYETKVDGGISLEYQNTKPQSSRWEPATLQGYPAVAFTGKNFDTAVTGTCVMSVGIRDDLAFGVGLSISDGARKRGVDPCAAVKEVADAVLTNLKGRA